MVHWIVYKVSSAIVVIQGLSLFQSFLETAFSFTSILYTNNLCSPWLLQVHVIVYIESSLVNGLLRSRCGNLAIMSLSNQTINEKSQINLKGFEGLILLGLNTWQIGCNNYMWNWLITNLSWEKNLAFCIFF